jgi:hypothetical protein
VDAAVSGTRMRAGRMMLMRTAKSCGPDAPMLASSGDNACALRLRRWQKSRSPGRARRKPLKPLRREGRVFPVDLWLLLACTPLSHARLRVPRAPGFPCALCFRGEGICSTRAFRAAGRWMCVCRLCLRQTRSVCARERERRSNPFFLYAVRWIASLALAMTSPVGCRGRRQIRSPILTIF